MNPIFFDIGMVIVLATVGGFIARALKQPMISFYILMGILLGPVFNIVKDMAVVDVLSEIGIAFLLFIVGIELDLKRLKDVGPVTTFGSLVVMGLIFLAGFGSFLLIGFGGTEGVYAGIVILFSSTMVVIKLLSDRSQLDTLHGRIVIGTLLIQDVVAVVLLSVMHSLNDFSIVALFLSVLQGVLVFVVALFFSKVLFPQLFKFAAKSQELFFLLSLAVCFFFSIVFASIGFSIAIGAFVAGLMLGNLPYNIEIISKVKNLRDFFATMFFVSMGIKLTFTSFQTYALPFIILLLLTVILSPLLTYIVTLSFGYNRKVAFLAAISLSQVSEFALIAVHQGRTLGHIGEGFMSLVIMVMLASIVITAYMIKYEDRLYRQLLPMLRYIDKIFTGRKHFDHHVPHSEHNVILVGYDRIGSRIYRSLKRMGKDVIILDFNPDVITHLMENNIPSVYGDIGDDEVLESMHLDKVQMIISTVPNHRDTLLMIKKVRRQNNSAKIIVTAYMVEEALSLYEEGADYVILPHLLGGEHAGVFLETVSTDLDKLIETKLAHIDELKKHHTSVKHKRSNMHPKHKR